MMHVKSCKTDARAGSLNPLTREDVVQISTQRCRRALRAPPQVPLLSTEVLFSLVTLLFV